MIHRNGSRRFTDRPVTITGIGYAEDPESMLSDRPPDGAALASAVGRCLQNASLNSAPPIGTVIVDLNGDERRALEWGYCLVRLRSRFDIGRHESWLPAASFGETGCAAGAIAICMAVRALQRAYTAARSVLVVSSSYGGSKGALCVSL
jgi:3-oxoacyl-[acyl-carrier-protein] synthase-1